MADCRFPGAPAHSTIEFTNTSLIAGTVASYSCERGFELLGPSRRICSSGGVWTPEGIPFCDMRRTAIEGSGPFVQILALSLQVCVTLNEVFYRLTD
uniref:Sushi domain-containing protein n=1 Tax=Rhodnius prolixus TaxID=13249 RepID=T1HTS7_RHOPR